MKLYALCCGRLEFARSLFFPDDASGAKMLAPVPCFLVVHPKGKLLFDTGVDCLATSDPVGRLGERIAKAFALRSGPSENVVGQLATLGLTPDDVTHVVNSHFHFDHCGCNALFQRATFLVQRAEMEAARAPRSPYNAAFWDHPLDYRLVDGELDVFGDGTVVLLPTPGHTPGHQSLRVRAAPGLDVVLAADACYTAEHLQRDILPVATSVWRSDTMLESLAGLRRMSDRQGCRIVFGHDAAQWASLRHAPEPMAA